MMISENTQLGLRFRNQDVQVEYLRCMVSFVDKRISAFNDAYKFANAIYDQTESTGKEFVSLEIANQIASKIGDEEYLITLAKNEAEQLATINKITLLIKKYYGDNFLTDDDSKFYLICDSVYKAAELIKIGQNFSSRTIKDIKFGKYTYLMGRNCMVRLLCVPGAIRGFYWNDKENDAFEFSLDIETGEYVFPADCTKQFSKVMQVLAFVELGDIEVIMLGKNKNNGGKKNENKIHNASNKTVYVVDSTWNKIIIRTDGFAVRGHFRLQPCGVNHADRKLMWIDAFEKHGYTRRPKAEIVR